MRDEKRSFAADQDDSLSSSLVPHPSSLAPHQQVSSLPTTELASLTWEERAR
jgi:hypothetical protein